MKKILFLTDFSEVAENAFIYALSVAERIKAEVHILHVTHIIETEDPDEKMRVHPLASFYNKRLQKDEWRDFKKEARRLEVVAQDNQKIDVPVEFHFEKGYFDEIVDLYIEEKDIDVVVMGTSGADTVDKKLFGSHTEYLINHVDIPLLAVPADAVYTEVRNFTLAVMLRENEYKIVNRLADNVLQSGGSLKCVYVAATLSEAETAQEKTEGWMKKIRNPAIPLEILVNNSVENGLKEFISRNKTDVLATIHRSRSFMQRLFRGSHSKRLLLCSRTALLIYKNNY
ncbi:MAG: universal stress protein [Niabella sp.]